MKVKLGKDFSWEMAHRLPFHEGPCKNIHGHSYKMRVELIGDLDENGMVLDFYDISRVVQPYIDKLDHAFLCNEKDEKVISFLKENNFKLYIMPNNTTSEYMAIYLANEFAPEFRKFKNLDAMHVRVYETVDAFAEVSIMLK